MLSGVAVLTVSASRGLRIGRMLDGFGDGKAAIDYERLTSRDSYYRVTYFF
jgi:hypothetical protein